ncbi:hypothetical protein KCX83_13650 [Brucella oryzae]|uniref:hypothetical protein n=1 Tax=Brucella oryzae TaxID=335286 RepID=UPI001B81BACD|nr:hypothetical protein [Brucella oryzae]MBR7653364.1 hypothetical protein [Brucella oryzae]
MDRKSAPWKPGSFTKNFSWGKPEAGLLQLQELIRIGFNNEAVDVPRFLFRSRVASVGRPDFIPLNFFLLNRVVDGVDTLVADELVFQAINFDHSDRFDKLALFAFNLSYVGEWVRAKENQRYPSLWSYYYINDRLSRELNWDASKATADDIEKFLVQSDKYTGITTRKVSTNLSYLYRLGKLQDLQGERVEGWWVDALFLALDRTLDERRVNRHSIDEDKYLDYLSGSGFHFLSGRRSIEKDIATRHLITLYRECGGPNRFSEESVRHLMSIQLPQLEGYLVNNNMPQIAVHPSNPRIAKAIPRICAMLARYSAGFDVFDTDDWEEFDVKNYVKEQTKKAIDTLREKKISPTMTADELMKITRGK